MTPHKETLSRTAPLTIDQARGIAVRERNMAAYYADPNLCKYCNKLIEIRKDECIAHTRRRKFCDQSCAGSFNAPNRKKNGPRIVHSRNLVGKTFGRLAVISEEIVKNDLGFLFHLCRCECGQEKLVYRASLFSGNTTSCGCFKRELIGERSIKGAIPLEIQGPRYVFSRYKSSARDRGHEFSLTLEEFTKVIEGACVYCGVGHSIEHKRVRTTYLHNGADRVDSKQGYVSGNVVSCCLTCNYAKNKLSLEKFQEWITRIADFHANKYLSPW
jgi:hypothetical protein